MFQTFIKRKPRRASSLSGIFFTSSLYVLAVISHFFYRNQFFTVYFGLVALLAAIALVVGQRHN